MAAVDNSRLGFWLVLHLGDFHGLRVVARGAPGGRGSFALMVFGGKPNGKRTGNSLD
jgi:hypothetical protein